MQETSLKSKGGAVCLVCASSPSYLKTSTVNGGDAGSKRLGEREYRSRQNGYKSLGSARCRCFKGVL